MTHHLELDKITLAKGSHQTRESGICLMEAVSWWADEPHSDHPECVSPVLGGFGRNLNDVLPDSKRQELVPFIPLMTGTAGDGLDEQRGYMALDWLIRTYTPAWLDLAGVTAEAAVLRGFRRIADLSAARAVRPHVEEARGKAAAAGDAAWDAARDAARDAAGYAAWYAAGDAAWYAAGDAARDAAWDAARDAAGYAARDAASSAARDAARDAAWNAASAAASSAARAAAWYAAWNAASAVARAAASSAASDVLAPTVASIQDSAIGLFGDMIRGERTS